MPARVHWQRPVRRRAAPVLLPWPHQACLMARQAHVVNTVGVKQSSQAVMDGSIKPGWPGQLVMAARACDVHKREVIFVEGQHDFYSQSISASNGVLTGIAFPQGTSGCKGSGKGWLHGCRCRRNRGVNL